MMNEKSEGVNMANLTAMLLTCSFSFVLTTLPISIMTRMYDPWYMEAFEKEDYHAIADLDFAWNLVNLIWYLNYAINFFLYIISGPRFRAELYQMLFPCRRQMMKENSQTNLTNISTVSESTIQ